MVKNSSASVGDLRDAGSIPGSVRSPRGGLGNPVQHLAWKIPWTEEPGELQSIGSQGVGHDCSNLAHMQHISLITSLKAPSLNTATVRI